MGGIPELGTIPFTITYAGGMPKAHHGATRRTGAELVSAVHQAALDVIAEAGLRGASMDAIARHAGTGKAALYRRWPNVRALGLDVFVTTLAQAVPESFCDTGTLRSDLITSLQAFTAILTEPMQVVLRELISESAHDPALVAEYQRRLGGPMQLEFTAMLERARRRGEITRDTIDPMVLELPDAVVLHRLLISGEVMGAEECVDFVDSVMMPLLTGDLKGNPRSH
jgi:AcrR family transcriptional regulator